MAGSSCASNHRAIGTVNAIPTTNRNRSGRCASRHARGTTGNGPKWRYILPSDGQKYHRRAKACKSTHNTGHECGKCNPNQTICLQRLFPGLEQSAINHCCGTDVPASALGLDQSRLTPNHGKMVDATNIEL